MKSGSRIMHSSLWFGGLLLTLVAAGLHAQSVVNWTAVTGKPAAAKGLATSTSAAAAFVPAPIPPPLPDAQSAPPVDVGAMAGYVEHDGKQEPNIRIDRGQVSPELEALYAQKPGESQDAYIERMSQLYRTTQAQAAADTARYQAYLRSLAPVGAGATHP